MFKKKVEVKEKEVVDLTNVKLLTDIVKDHIVVEENLVNPTAFPNTDEFRHSIKLASVLGRGVDSRVFEYKSNESYLEQSRKFINQMKELGFPIVVFSTILNEFKYHADLINIGSVGVSFFESRSRIRLKYSGDVPEFALDLIGKYKNFKDEENETQYRELSKSAAFGYVETLPYLVTIHSNEPLEIKTFKYMEYRDPVVIAWSRFISEIKVNALGQREEVETRHIARLGAVLAFWDANGNSMTL